MASIMGGLVRGTRYVLRATWCALSQLRADEPALHMWSSYRDTGRVGCLSSTLLLLLNGIGLDDARLVFYSVFTWWVSLHWVNSFRRNVSMSIQDGLISVSANFLGK